MDRKRKRRTVVAIGLAAVASALVLGTSAFAAEPAAAPTIAPSDVQVPDSGSEIGVSTADSNLTNPPTYSLSAYGVVEGAPTIATHRVSPAEARQFGLQEGAVTEGVVPANPRPAAGAAGATAATAEATTQAAHYCWGNRVTLSKGTYPYNRTLIVYTYWCGYLGGALTYRSTNVSWSTGPLCANEGTNQYKISGGVGYSWVKIHTEAWFGCDSPWWFKLHDSIWMNVVYNSWGSAAVPEWG